MTSLFQFLAALFFVQRTTSAKGHYGWCGPYDTFCLFSAGIETRVSDLSEAQFKCSEIKNDSWPVELGDERVKEVFIEFIRNYSISNVILNAFNQNGTWYWKKNNSSVKNIFNVKDNIMFYNNSGFYSNYSVVCMTDCRANWTEIKETQSLSSNPYHNLSIKLEECKEICEKNLTCSSVDWTSVSAWQGCWIHKYPYDASKLNPKLKYPGTSHYVIDRTVKSINRCIGEDIFFFPESTQNESHKESQIESTKIVKILVPIVLIFSILIIVIAIIILFKRRTKKADSSEDFGAYKPAEVVGNSQFQQNESKTSNKKSNTYCNIEDLNNEPNRYPGPRGDQYTEVDINGKQSSVDGIVNQKHDT